MDVEDARNRLLAIEKALQEGNYKRGEWQRFVRQASALDAASRRSLAGDITRVSRTLHARNGFVSIPFGAGLGIEIAAFIAAILALAMGSVFIRVVGVALLALCLQPLIKTIMGLAVGVRYDYAYLWYVEPRFKMQFGTYICLEPPVRVLLHLSGAIGTPLAMLVGYLVFASGPMWLAYAFAVLFAGALLLQVGAFAAELLGVRMVGPFRLSNLTSPATAAMELRRRE